MATIEFTTYKDPLWKIISRGLYRLSLLFFVYFFAGKKNETSFPRVFYGGARSGNRGGTLVKIQRLQKYFPQKMRRFNTIYLMSNAPYLNHFALREMKARGISLVLNQNGVFYSSWFRGDWRAQNARMAKAYHIADHVFWQSEFCRKSADRFLGARSQPGEILYNAIDLCHFTPKSSLKLVHPNGPFIFLLTGKFTKHLYYRIENAIAGLGMARKNGLEVALNIAGWVEKPEVITEIATTYELQNQVHYLGAYNQEGAPSIYQMADAYLMTKYLDPCPNTVLEAMACGLPVLYSKSGGVTELVGDTAGIGIEVCEDWANIHVPSPEQVAGGMFSIMEKRTSFARGARIRSEKYFDIKKWVARHEAVFNQLLERHL